MAGVGKGMSEEAIAEARRVDERVLPKEDVGLFTRLKVVWATKGGDPD